MSNWHLETLAAESARLIALAATDADLRAALRQVAEHILAGTAEPSSLAVDRVCDASVPKSVPMPLSAEVPLDGMKAVEPGDDLSRNGRVSPDATRRGRGEPLRELTLGGRSESRKGSAEPLRELTLGSRPAPPKATSASAASTMGGKFADDLSTLSDRCQAKADAARRAARRLRQFHETLQDPLDDPPSDPELADWADRLTDDLYFGDHFDETDTSGIGRMERLGGCFETLGHALAVAERCQNHVKKLERVLPLLAEAQSALRASVHEFRPTDEPEQRAAFDWLKDMAARNSIYIKRFMRLDDSGDPVAWENLLDRIKKLEPRETIVQTGSSTKVSRLDPISAAIEQLAECRRADGDTLDAWLAIVTAVDDQVRDGLKPSNRELRELLLPIVNDIPEFEELPAGFRLVLREIDRFVASASPSSSDAVNVPSPTAEVSTVARFLGGRSVVLIGGDRRREAEEALTRAFALKELVWAETKEHQSVSTFEPLVARRDVALVLLAIRWSSHSFGDVKLLCDLYGKPLVRLPGGYSPNQVAAQITDQSSEQLSAE